MNLSSSQQAIHTKGGGVADASAPRSRRLRTIAIASLIALIASFGAALGIAAPAQAAGPTVVSLTFDDGNIDQLAAAQSMNSKGLPGTFYIISGYVDQPGYFTRANLATIAADPAGNEIGGHTVHHLDLTTLTPDDVKREICNDRVNLTNWGYQVTSFAYPYASVNDAAEAAVQACGYNSARGLGDLKTPPGTECQDCDNAETVPPADPYYTRAADEIDSSWDLAAMQKRVTDAEAEGGWVQFTFHHICDDCGTDPALGNISTTLFDQFTTWLTTWQDGSTKTVKTVNSVVGGAVQPVVPGPGLTPPPGPGVNGSQNPSLETPGSVANIPQCWWASSFGTNTPTFTTVTPGHTGAAAVKVTMTNYVDGDAKLLALFDESGCAPSVTPGSTYSLRAFYTSTANTQFAVYTRNSIGTWTYWTSSPLFGPVSSYTQAEWTTPAIPADVTGISFGLNITANGELTTDDYAIYDSVGAPLLALSPVDPIVTGTAQVGQTLTANSGAWGPVPVSIAYQWQANGIAIPGATATTYQPVAGDVGKLLTVAVTGTKTGYESVTTTSVPTAAVIAADATTVRYAGVDRFATSAAISAAAFAPGVPVAYVASGLNFPDALSGAAAAGALGGPVLLVYPDLIPTSISAELHRLAPAKIVVLGGPTTVSAGVFTELQSIAPTTRQAGVDRFATSAAISAAAFAPGVPVAYVASGLNFPDALSGAAAAGALGGPVLLVYPDLIPTSIATELDRLNPAKIVVLGGPTTVSDSVLNTLKATAPTTRQAGVDRFATSAAISAAAFAPGVPVAYVASGLNFPDALSGAAAAGALGGPVLLVYPDLIPTSIATELDRLNPAKIVVLGGPTTVSDNVMTALQGYVG